MVLHVVDDVCLDWIFQPIGNWSNKNFGLHPQTIAEFFGAGAVLAEVAYQALQYFFLDHKGTILSSLYIFLSCIGILLSFVWYRAIAQRINYKNGRNPKRIIFFNLRMLFLIFIIFDIVEMPLVVRDGSGNFLLVHLINMANSVFTWFGLSFSAVDEPPAHRQVIWGIVGG